MGMREEQILEPMMTDASCMREDGMFSTQNFLRRHGRRRWTNGLEEQNPNSLNGLERGQERNLENLSLQKMKMMQLEMLLLVLWMKRRKKKRRRRKKSKLLTF